MRKSDFLVRMDAVAVHGEAVEDHIVALEGVEPFGKRTVVVQQDFGVGMIVARITAAADFHGFDAGGLQLGEGLIEGLFRVEVFADADFHEITPYKLAGEGRTLPRASLRNQNL